MRSGELPRSGAMVSSSLSNVQQAVDYVNASKVCEGGKPSMGRKLAAGQVNQPKGFQPSGPRAKGVGCEDEEQGILHAEAVEGGGAKLWITILAAGFVIGPSGTSVREISKATGAEIRSWNDKKEHHGKLRQVRVVVLEGKKRSVVLAMEVVVEAVERYKELCEGKFAGHAVDRAQQIRNCTFYYQPPPRAAVPYAAALKSHADRSKGPVKMIDLPLDQHGGEREESHEEEKENRAEAANAQVVPQGSLPGVQLVMVSPHLAVPVDARIPINQLLSAGPAPSSATPLTQLCAPTTTPREQAGQLLAALRSLSPSSGAMGEPMALCGGGRRQQAQPQPSPLLAPRPMLSQMPMTPESAPAPLPAPVTRRLQLEHAAAGNLDSLIPSMELEKLQSAEVQPPYNLFGSTGPLLGADLLPIPAPPAEPTGMPTGMPTPSAGGLSLRQLDPEELLMACGFPTFTGFAQQSPYYHSCGALFQSTPGSKLAAPAAHWPFHPSPQPGPLVLPGGFCGMPALGSTLGTLSQDFMQH